MSSSATAKASAYRGRGGGGGGGGAPPEQDGRPMDEYQGPDEGVYMHTHTVLAPKDVSSCDVCCGTVHFCLCCLYCCIVLESTYIFVRTYVCVYMYVQMYVCLCVCLDVRCMCICG